MSEASFTDYYETVLNTPPLWSNSLSGIKQFELPQKIKHINDHNLAANRRLGHVVEDLLLKHINDSDLECLISNIQIVQSKRSIGEMDFLLKDQQGSIHHVEAAFKFYLYDDKANPQAHPSGLSPEEIKALAPWIGPNRRDSLLQKIDKLSAKQFPLLFNPATLPYLNELNINTEEVKQSTIFKAQLFIPFGFDLNSMPSFDLLNRNCIKGIYLNKTELENFKAAEFYIPNKIDWLLEPSNDVNWIDYDDLIPELDKHFARQNAPLCWMKNSDDGQLQKVIIVWW